LMLPRIERTQSGPSGTRGSTEVYPVPAEHCAVCD
jgi:hypothetical protein